MAKRPNKVTTVLLELVAVLSLTGSGTAQVISDRAAARFLEQSTWGPSSESIAKLKQMGIPAWLEWQLSLPSSPLPAQPTRNADGSAFTDSRQLQNWFIANAVLGEDQLRQRVAFALSKIWVVSQLELSYSYWIPSYWKTLSDESFGNYANVIYLMSRNSAMGFYLNTANNQKAVSGGGFLPNENFARELMQLFTIGLKKLNSNGLPMLDANQREIPTFTEQDVKQIAKVLTGWTYPPSDGQPSQFPNPVLLSGQMVVFDEWHDSSEKRIFGTFTIGAGQTADQELRQVIGVLMQQDSMAPFVSRQLIQNLVTSNPSPDYIARVSNVFQNNGSGVRGDLRAVVRAILTDVEARVGDSEVAVSRPDQGHLREPMLMVAQLMRGLSVRPLAGDNLLYYFPLKLGQNLFNAPAVFSYFSPQYAIRYGLTAPEFEIYHSTHAINRLNVVHWILNDAFKSRPLYFGETTPFRRFGRNIDQMLLEAERVFFHNSMPPSVRSAALRAATGLGNANEALEAALYIVLTSSEYQIAQ